MNFKPNLNLIAILPDPVSTKTDKGVYLPEQSLEMSSVGTVCAAGKGVYDSRKECYVPMQVKEGDRVIYPKDQFEVIVEDNQGYLLMPETALYACNDQPINNYVAVQFDEEYLKKVKVGSLVLDRPDRWVFEQDETTTLYDTNRNLKDTKPQIAKVIKTNPKCHLKEGDEVFCHYLEYDKSVKINLDGVECKFLNFHSVFFRINGEGDYDMAPNTYLGERVIDEAPKTASGIYLRPYDTIPKGCHIKITHAPKEAKRELGSLKAGDIAVTSDDNQYEIKVHDKTYVKLTGEWVIGNL